MSKGLGKRHLPHPGILCHDPVHYFLWTCRHALQPMYVSSLQLIYRSLYDTPSYRLWKWNWMSSGCQSVINHRFGSLMITWLHDQRGSLSPWLSVAAESIHISSEKKSAGQRGALNWIVLGQMQYKNKDNGVKRCSSGFEVPWWNKFIFISHSAWCVLLSSPVQSSRVVRLLTCQFAVFSPLTTFFTFFSLCV